MLRIKVKEEHSLWEELEELNIVLKHSCGGTGTCGACEVILADGSRVLACQYKKAGVVELEEGCFQKAEEDFYSIGSIKKKLRVPKDGAYVIADIGTTTVAGVLAYKGEQKLFRFVNPQRRFGADVMSRIKCANEGGGERLQSVLTEALEKELEMFAAGVSVIQFVVSANTTMQHLLEGKSTESLGVAPFATGDISLHHFSFHRKNGVEWKVTMLPGISAFVGADIVSGLLDIHIMKKEKPCLFVDIGTNGELALGCAKKLLVTSTSAGPAFEGSELATKLYASGIMKLLHRLKTEGIMDAYGTLEEPYFTAGYPVSEYTLTQETIRELQMAKAAIFAGIRILLETYGIGANAVETVYVAGGMGNFMEEEDALAIGLLPDSFAGKIKMVGNASLNGALQYAEDTEAATVELEAICGLAKLISLPDCEHFEEYYIDAMNF